MRGNEVGAASTHHTQGRNVQGIDIGWLFLQILVVVVNGGDGSHIHETAGRANDDADVRASNITSTHEHDVSNHQIGGRDAEVLLVANHHGRMPHLR